MIFKIGQFLYQSLSQFSNSLYDNDFIKKIDLKIPVISVGNLSVGGTGKTPCVQLLATQFLQNKKTKKVVIVSRSYKADLKKPQKVDLKRIDAPKLFGDEPCLLQTLLPEVSVWAGPLKYQTAQAALVEQPDLIIIDDGFSHRRLHRNFDLLLIDVTVPIEHLQILPAGRLRESLVQLKRADAILLTRVNLVESKKIDLIKKIILEHNPNIKNSIYESESRTAVQDFSDSKDIFVFCGLGNPEAFKKSLEFLGYKIQVFKKYSDHYMYSKKDLDELLEQYKNRKDLKLVTTEKDLIKIKEHPILEYIHIAKNIIEISGNKTGELIEKIFKKF